MSKDRNRHLGKRVDSLSGEIISLRKKLSLAQAEIKRLKRAEIYLNKVLSSLKEIGIDYETHVED